MQIRQLWYTRRDDEVRGPFPAGLITRYILLGRIRESDELSLDQLEWKRVADLPDLIPPLMRPGDGESEEERLQRLTLARRWEDERLAGDRRRTHLSASDKNYQRRAGDRRQAEPPELIQHRVAKTAARKLKKPRENYLPQLLIAGVILAAVGALAIYYPTELAKPAALCNAAAQPRVNWSNCTLDGIALKQADLRGANLHNARLGGADLYGAKLTGADLAYANFNNADMRYADLQGSTLLGASLRNADLSNANLQGADLSYANFAGANLGGANLEGAKLDRAIWFDNSVCAVGSRGECRAPASMNR